MQQKQQFEKNSLNKIQTDKAEPLITRPIDPTSWWSLNRYNILCIRQQNGKAIKWGHWVLIICKSQSREKIVYVHVQRGVTQNIDNGTNQLDFPSYSNKYIIRIVGWEAQSYQKTKSMPYLSNL